VSFRPPKIPEVKQSAGINIDDIPMAALTRKLELSWQPNGDTFLQPGSVGRTALASDVTTQLAGASAVHLVGATGEPAFENGASAWDSPHPVGFYKAGGRVHLEGLVRVSTLNTTIFTLPPVFCPASVSSPAGVVLLVNATDGLGTLRVFWDGRVVCTSGVANSWLSLYGVNFRSK